MKARFHFQEGVNTLIGENGSGKTNAFQALRLLLDESLERNAIYLRETDFCRDLGVWRGHWVIVSADFASLDAAEGCQLLRHTAAHMDGTQTGTCSFYFRPKLDVRKKLYELSGAGEGLEAYLSTLTIDQYEPVMTGRATGDLLNDDVYHAVAGDPDAGTFPNPDEDDQDILGVRIPPLYQEVACTFVRALRDVVAELRNYRGNPLLALLRGMESSIQIADAENITGQVKKLNQDISTLGEITKLAGGIETTLRNAVGHTYGPGVSIESQLPESMEKLLQRLTVFVGDSAQSSYKGELQEQSLGGANLIYLALKLLEYERKMSYDRAAHFFLVEEPEAHIHTHIQKTLFSNLPSQRTQVIVSTHSTHISSAARIASVNVLARRGDHAEVFQPASGLAIETVKRVERYLDAVRSTLLFAKGVLLVEGDAEQIMIPAMLREVFGTSPDEMGFSVISMNSAFFEHVAVVFAEERIQRPCAILTDLDESLIDLPEDSAEDTKQQARARRAQLLGRTRRTALEGLANGNDWIEFFLAQYTFEVSFLASNNSHEVVNSLEDVFEQQAARDASQTKLQDEQIKVAGAEVVRLANKCGKGWFALLLSERLGWNTYIPEYVLRAVAFTCHPSIGEGALRRIGEFRLGKQGAGGGLLKAQPRLADPALPNAEFLRLYREADGNDDLSLFCDYLDECRA